MMRADLRFFDVPYGERIHVGPVCVRQLGDWGANVIRIERPGDPADFAGRHEADFQNKHRNKRGMAINLRSDEGRSVLYRLAECAEITIAHSFRRWLTHANLLAIDDSEDNFGIFAEVVDTNSAILI